MSSTILRRTLWVLGAGMAVTLIVAAYQVFGPGAMDFARGKRVALAAYSQDPTGVPTALRNTSLVEHGEYLTRAADCVACHTSERGVPFAGGRAFVLPFGTLYSTNITPDPQTGIGEYSDQNFLDAMRRGVGRGNRALYPAMPYTCYTLLSDGDVLAIKAYLFSLTPVRARPPPNTLTFPFNQRGLMRLWAVFFNPDKRFEPNSSRTAQWNRGAYMAEALEHCGECHTPRNLLFALNNRRKFAGANQAGWRAYNITPDRETGVGNWTDAELTHYLSMGHAQGHGSATGPMGEAVDLSLQYLDPEDLAAIVAYLHSTVSLSSDVPPLRLVAAKPTPYHDLTTGAESTGRAVYEGACAGCHGWSGDRSAIPRASLIGTRSVNDPSATNVAQVIIHGGPGRLTDDPGNMPAFGSAYTDEEIAGVANYLTARFGSQGSSLTAADVSKLRHQD